MTRRGRDVRVAPDGSGTDASTARDALPGDRRWRAACARPRRERSRPRVIRPMPTGRTRTSPATRTSGPPGPPTRSRVPPAVRGPCRHGARRRLPDRGDLGAAQLIAVTGTYLQPSSPRHCRSARGASSPTTATTARTSSASRSTSTSARRPPTAEPPSQPPTRAVEGGGRGDEDGPGRRVRGDDGVHAGRQGARGLSAHQRPPNVHHGAAPGQQRVRRAGLPRATVHGGTRDGPAPSRLVRRVPGLRGHLRRPARPGLRARHRGTGGVAADERACPGRRGRRRHGGAAGQRGRAARRVRALPGRRGG